jgi:pyridinium-3,5-biscarboxylic acid mononucleotide synthase
MDQGKLDDASKTLARELLERVAAGQCDWTELAERALQHAHPASRAHQPDRDRRRRCGFPEVIYGAGKSPAAIVEIAKRLLAAGESEILVTRVAQEQLPEVVPEFAHARYDALGRTLRLSDTTAPLDPVDVGQSPGRAAPSAAEGSARSTSQPAGCTVPESHAAPTPAPTPVPVKDTVGTADMPGGGRTDAQAETGPEPRWGAGSQPASNPVSNPGSGPVVAVVSAGSTDLPVAREALETLAWMGVASYSLSDVGVAGPYRLLPHLPRLRAATAIVVVAGMEGALASVMGGLVPCPIIAVPTSVGYGANLQGVTTLLSMLSSCAAGVTVVNIDAGFKGGYIAGLIAHRVQQALAAGPQV